MFKVTNKMKDVRKFRDLNQGKDILINPGESVLTTRPPQPSEVFKVEVAEKIEKKEEKKQKKPKKEDDKL